MERALSPDGIDVTFREATEADHLRLSQLVREWWDERPPRLERRWFRHFGATSVVGESRDGRPVALAIAFRSPTIPGRGVLAIVAVAPSHRRRGVGRAAVQQAIRRLRQAGATTVSPEPDALSIETAVWPGNRAGVRFLEALGFEADAASRSTPLYGVPAFADYDGDGEDRAVLVLSVPAD